jgi:hypothetical protein
MRRHQGGAIFSQNWGVKTLWKVGACSLFIYNVLCLLPH